MTMTMQTSEREGLGLAAKGRVHGPKSGGKRWGSWERHPEGFLELLLLVQRISDLLPSGILCTRKITEALKSFR